MLTVSNKKNEIEQHLKHCPYPILLSPHYYFTNTSLFLIANMMGVYFHRQQSNLHIEE